MNASQDRPPIAIGHITLQVGEVGRSTRFFEALGLRRVFVKQSMAILELRGGTHLLLFPAERRISDRTIRNFDLMVDDVEELRKKLASEDLSPSEIRRDDRSGHLWFEVVDPDGRSLGVYSTHTEGRPV